MTMEFTDNGPRGVRAGHEADRRARARLRDARRRLRTAARRRGAAEDFFQRFAITLDNQIVSLATIDYQENPEGIDGRTGAADRGHRHHPGGPGPRREPAHRRPADQPQADLADAGVGHARPAGARPGPHRRRRRPRADDPLPAHLLPRARRGGDAWRCCLRGAAVRAGQADPDHAHAARASREWCSPWRWRPTRTSSSSSE